VTVEKFTVKVNESLSLESQSEIRNFGNGSYLEVEKFNDPEISYKMSISLKKNQFHLDLVDCHFLKRVN
jgi:hypothetical protein